MTSYNKTPVDHTKIVLCKIGHAGPQYRSMHDARPTAPTGTLWRVSRLEGRTAYLWAVNGWNKIIEETADAIRDLTIDRNTFIP